RVLAVRPLRGRTDRRTAAPDEEGIALGTACSLTGRTADRVRLGPQRCAGVVCLWPRGDARRRRDARPDRRRGGVAGGSRRALAQGRPRLVRHGRPAALGGRPERLRPAPAPGWGRDRAAAARWPRA